MRNVSHILEKQLTDYLVTDQARFYRLAYSYLKNREEALDAVQTAVCRALEKQQRGEGFCLVEVLSPCPTNWGLSPVDSLTFMREKQKAFFQVGEFVDKNAEGGM